MIKFDSFEEKYFSWYMDELKEVGYIKEWVRVEEGYVLSKDITKTYLKKMKRVKDKIITQTILRGHVYTPDFKITWTDKAINVFVQDLVCKEKIVCPFIAQEIDNELVSIIEVKGNFDMNNMTRLVINNCKSLYDRQGVYVNIIKVPKIFKDTFVPKKYLLTDKTHKRRSIKFKINLLK